MNKGLNDDGYVYPLDKVTLMSQNNWRYNMMKWNMLEKASPVRYGVSLSVSYILTHENGFSQCEKAIEIEDPRAFAGLLSRDRHAGKKVDYDIILYIDGFHNVQSEKFQIQYWKFKFVKTNHWYSSYKHTLLFVRILWYVVFHSATSNITIAWAAWECNRYIWLSVFLYL